MGYDLKKNNREKNLDLLLFMDDLKFFAKSEEIVGNGVNWDN